MRAHLVAPAIDQIGRDQRAEEQALRAEKRPEQQLAAVEPGAGGMLVLTVIEVAIFYIPALKGILVPTLLGLSALKFALVAAFYMHLKFDHRLFSWLFVVPMFFAVAVILALMVLFGVLARR